MKKNIFILLIIFVTMTIFGKLTVAVSIIPEKFLVEKITGDKAEVFELIPPGYSPANYAPTTRQLIEFSDSDIYFSIGVPTEKANILPKISANAPNVKVVSLADYVDSIYEPRFFAPGKRDPHIWLSPKRMVSAVDKITEEISKIDPENSVFYENNSDTLKEELQKLDSELKNTLSNLKNRGFYIYHPSFGYFADEYGLAMYALEEDGKKATPRRIAKLVDSAEENGVKVIFYQAEIDSAQVESFAREINGQSLQINPLAYDYFKNLEMIGETFKNVLNEEK